MRNSISFTPFNSIPFSNVLTIPSWWFGLTIVLTILFMPKGLGGFIDRYFLEKRFKKKTGTEKT